VSDSLYQRWIPVIGRSLAYLCVSASEFKDGSLGQKAGLLEVLGVDRKEVAAMLGSTPASITETLRKAKTSKKGGRNIGKTTRRKTR